MHSQRVCLIEGSFELVLERLFVVFTLAKDVLLHLKRCLDVIHPALGLHALELFFSAFTHQLFHIQGGSAHALGTFDLAHEVTKSVLLLADGSLEASEDLGSFTLSLARVLHTALHS